MVNDDLTYRVIGCAMKVHRTLGAGFQDVIYQRALAIEMRRAGIDFGREVEQPILYDGVEIGSRRADFIVGNRVVVELKALTALENLHLAQVKNYVVAYGLELGLLLNFDGQSLEYRRIYGGNRQNQDYGDWGIIRIDPATAQPSQSCKSCNPVNPDSDNTVASPLCHPRQPNLYSTHGHTV